MKSTVDEIRQRFDADVERFSNLDVGQSATVDAPLAPPANRPGVAGCLRRVPPDAAAWRLDVGIRSGQEFDPNGSATPA
jgi:hypothetical protein